MDDIDKKDWLKFLGNTTKNLSKEEVLLVSELHAKYFKHKLQIPCSCSPKTIQGWIYDINKIYNAIE